MRSNQSASALIFASQFPLSPIQSLKDTLFSYNRKLYLEVDSKLVFVCGANAGAKIRTARNDFLNYAYKNLDHLNFFQAEDVFSVLEKEDGTDLLGIEHQLASITDCIILFMESPGVFAEVGAFAILDELAETMLVVNEKTFYGDGSFISEGPLKKIDRVSNFGKVIYGKLENVLNSGPEIEERLRYLKSENRKGVDLSNGEKVINVNRKHRMLFLSDLISIFGPVLEEELKGILKRIYDFNKRINNMDISVDISLLLAIGIIKSNNGLLYREKDLSNMFFDFKGTNNNAARASIFNFYRKISPERVKILRENL